MSPQEKKHIHEVAGSKSYVKAGYSNFPELPRAAQILWESFASNQSRVCFACGMIRIVGIRFSKQSKEPLQ